MRRPGYLLAAALVVVVNGIVLAGVAYNRTGVPTARMVLTARELPVASSYFPHNSEDTGLSLHIRW